MQYQKAKKIIIPAKTKSLIKRLKLRPHPEGGYYRETYRAAQHCSIGDGTGCRRNLATSIYYLLSRKQFTPFHRLKSDEIWHLLHGSPVVIHMLFENGKYVSSILGPNVASGARPEIIIRAGVWFAAELANKSSFALVSCLVVPGFDFADFEEACCATLSATFPRHRSLIARFTRQ